MTEPVSASALVTIVVVQAAQELGKRIGGIISDRLFGSELSENQALLKSIARDIKTILTDVRKIYLMVEQIPDIVHGEILRNELYKAHVNLESNIETFQILQSWNDTLGYDALVNVLNSWKLITDKEDTVDMIWQIPKYADFLMMITRKEAKLIVLAGLDNKIEALESRKEILIQDYLLKIINQIETLFSGEYVERGELLSDNPWVKYSMKPDKTKKIKVCEPLGPRTAEINLGGRSSLGKIEDIDLEGLSRDYCFIVDDIPNVAWNNQKNTVNSNLLSLSEKLDNTIKELRTITFTLTLLTTYKERLNSGFSKSNEVKTKFILSDDLFNLT